MSNYFQNSRSSEMAELQNDLNSLKQEVKMEAVKQVIASMTYGKDVSSLFPHVVKCMETNSLELKKMVYLYIINYSRTKPDLTIMAINTFRKDAHEESSPILRSLAVRTMGCIRIDKITEYLCESLKDALHDSVPYVRKTAAICVAKLFCTSPQLVRDHGFIKILKDMLSDGNAIVVANSIIALMEISNLTGHNYIKFNLSNTDKILYAINDCNEWGQVYLLQILGKYVPNNSNSAENIIERVIPRISHANPSVVISAIKVIFKMLDFLASGDFKKKIMKKIAASLTTLLSLEANLQFVVLKNIEILLEKEPNIFDTPRPFFVRAQDPLFVKLEKILILEKILLSLIDANGEMDQNILNLIMNELKEYSSSLEIDFVKKSIDLIGTITLKVPKSTSISEDILMNLVRFSGSQYSLEVATIALAKIFKKYNDATGNMIADIVKKGECYNDPEAFAAYVWIVGEYIDLIENYSQIFHNLFNIILEVSLPVQFQILSASVKLFVKYPTENEKLIFDLFDKVTKETDNPDLRDRAYIYWRMLSTDPDKTKEMITTKIPWAQEDLKQSYEKSLVDYLIDNLGTMVSIFHATIEQLVNDQQMPKKVNIDQDEDEEPLTVYAPELNIKIENPVNKESNPISLIDNADLNEEKADKNGKVEKVEKNLLDLDLDINLESSEKYPELEMGKKVKIEKILSEHIVGFKGKNGVNVIGCFVRKDGIIYLNLRVKNCTSSNFSKIRISISKNSFGLGGDFTLDNIGGNSSKILSKNCTITEDDLTKEAPFSPYFIKGNIEISSFDRFDLVIPLYLHVLLKDTMEIDKETFKQYWVSFPKSNELSKEFPDLKFIDQSLISKFMKENNYFEITSRQKKETLQQVLYFTAMTINNLPILVEIELPNEAVPKTSILVKSAVSILCGLVVDSVEALIK